MGNKEDDLELLALTELLEDTPPNVEKPNSTVTTFVPRLQEDNTFFEAFTETDKTEQSPTVKHKTLEEIDSSDDEEVRNYLERKYNEYGRDINTVLKEEQKEKHAAKVEREVEAAIKAAPSCQVKNPHNPIKRVAPAAIKLNTTPVRTSVYTDPVFGFRLTNPLISSALLSERMKNRKNVSFSNLVLYTQSCDLKSDWVVAGVVVSKSPVRISKKGDAYSLWRLSDLRGEIKMLSLFLFGSAHKELWKTTVGCCIAILNPTVLEKRAEGGDIATLSIDTAKKVMILGQSKDFGICKAKKRNGEACTAVVNVTECDVCLFHMKQEYSKMSQRAEFQSASLGRGLNALRNKVLGKSEVFYGGQSFTAVPAKKNAKLVQKDMNRLSMLSDYAVSPFAREENHAARPKGAFNAVPYAERTGAVSRIAGNVEMGTKQRVKDLERLKHLETTTTTTTTMETKTPTEVPEKFKNRAFSFAKQTPRLSSENFCLEVNVSTKQAAWSKQKALELLKKKPLEKVNPNSTRGSREGKRRAIDELNEKFDSNEKRLKLNEEQQEQERKTRLQRIMDATSAHSNLIEMREEDEREKYFNKMEKKEAMEDKMLQTFKMPCKAVICLVCKYTAFSAAERCKQEKHALKVVDAEKRFFECADCHNRTVTVFKLPKTSCKNCQGSNWRRAAMIRERKVCDGTEALSIRGDEEVFVGSLSGKASLNLLVPEDS